MVDSVLHDFIKYGGYIQTLQNFEQEVISCSFSDDIEVNTMSQTYQAFQSAIALGFLNSFKGEITRIEKLIVKQGMSKMKNKDIYHFLNSPKI